MASTIWPTPPSTTMSPHLSSVQNYYGNITFQHMICSPSTVMLANPLIAHSNTELSLLWLLITSEMSPITPASASLPVSDGTRSNNWDYKLVDRCGWLTICCHGGKRCTAIQLDHWMFFKVLHMTHYGLARLR